jgi:hypothetical protein
MTNKLQLIAILTLATILITGGFSLTPLAYSTGSSNGNNNGNSNSNNYGDNNNNYGNSNGYHDDDDDDDKVKVCHIPQGNPGNAHTIKISQSAVAAHLGHGDTLGACPQDEDDDDDEDDDEHDGKTKTASITLYKAITTDNKLAPSEDPDFDLIIENTTDTIHVSSGETIIVDAGTYQMNEDDLEGYSFVLIAGDTQCPSKRGTDFIVKGGDKIECTIYNQDDFVEGQTGGDGVFFARNSIQMNIETQVFNEANSMHGCSNVPDGIVRPCVTVAGDILLIVDPALDENGGEFAAIAYTVIPAGGNTASVQCSSIAGIGEHTFTGVTDPVRGFLLDCGAIDESGNYNINYAIIKTTQVPI